MNYLFLNIQNHRVSEWVSEEEKEQFPPKVKVEQYVCKNEKDELKILKFYSWKT